MKQKINDVIRQIAKREGVSEQAIIDEMQKAIDEGCASVARLFDLLLQCVKCGRLKEFSERYAKPVAQLLDGNDRYVVAACI